MFNLPKAKVNDINMYYEIHGDGFPLVMIMGLSLSLEEWDAPFINELSKNFKTIIFDNRGAGRTDKPNVEYSIKMFAADTTGLMNALNIQRAHLLGVSMGGMIAQELVLNYPERVEKLILWGTNCGGTKSIPPSLVAFRLLLGAIEGLTPEKITKASIPLILTKEFRKNNPDYVEDKIRRFLKFPIPLNIYNRQLRAIMNFNTYRRLKNINTPTLIMQGKKDILNPYQNAKILAEKIPGANVSLFNNSGHAIYPHEPEKFIKTILDFLK